MPFSKPSTSLPFLLSFWLLLFLFVQYSVSLGVLTIGFPVSSFFIPSSLLLTTIIFFILERKNISWKNSALVTVLAILIILFTPLLAGILLDTTWDGQWYHQAAIAKIADGWNPIHEPNYALTPYDQTNYLWVQHYPKFAWITGAGIYKQYQSIEAAKATNFIMLFIAFLQSLYLCQKLPLKYQIFKWIVAFVIAFNPVVVAQLFSNYVDGLMASSITILTLLFVSVLFVPNEKLRNETGIMILVAICIACNLKFTGIVLSGMLGFLFMLLLLMKKTPWKVTFRWTGLFAATYLFAILAWGFNPYITNYVSKGHPLYPLNDSKQFSYIMHNEPVMMQGKTNAEKLFISVFSETANDIKADKISIRIPGVISKNEFRIWAGADVRVSGLGPFFSLAFILALIAIMSVWFSASLERKQKLYITIFSLGIVLSAILFPQSWWARFSPQLFLFPALTAFLILYFSNYIRQKFSTRLSYAIIIVLLANVAVISSVNWGANVVKTNLIKKEMDALRKVKKPILISFYNTDFQTSRIRLKEANVMFTEMDSLPAGQVKELRTIYSLDGFGPKYIIQP